MPKFSAYMKGGDGSAGPPGASIIDGILANESMLPIPNQNKYAFLVGTSNPKHLWVWNDQKEGENKWEDQGPTASEINKLTASISTVAWNVPPSITTQFSTSNLQDSFNFDFNIPMGRPAGFGDFTATISSTNWDAEPAITTSSDGEDWEKNIHYDFTIPVGRPAGFGEISVTTESLPSGSKPNVSISTNEESPDYAKDFNFKFAIPEGVAAGFSTGQYVSVSTLDTGEDAVVEITTVTSSPETAKEFNFHFGLPRGDALAIYEGIPFTTQDGLYYHWDTTNTTTLVFDRGTVEKLPIYIYNNDNESIAATFKLSASTIEYEADEKFNGTMYLAMPTTLQNVEIGTVSSTTYGHEPVISKSTGSTSTNLILDFIIPEGYPGHTIIDGMTTNIQTLFTEVNSITTTLSGKQDTYATNTTQWDTTPTTSSVKPVTSGGIKTALDCKATLYTDISQLGFSDKTTIVDLVLAMSNNSILITQGENALTSSELPNSFATWGTLKIAKYNNSRWYAKWYSQYASVDKYYEYATSGAFSNGVLIRTSWKQIHPNILYFTNQPCSTSGTITRIPSNGTDDRITSNTVVLQVTFSKPSAITSNVSWSSSEGYITFTGTCTDSTCTMNVTLGQKGN